MWLVALLVPEARSPCSSRATLSPLRALSRATAAPEMPPPMTIRSRGVMGCAGSCRPRPGAGSPGPPGSGGAPGHVVVAAAAHDRDAARAGDREGERRGADEEGVLPALAAVRDVAPVHEEPDLPVHH